MNGQNGCSTNVVLTSDAVNPLYVCRGQKVTLNCEVTNGASLDWASEPNICPNLPISYTAFNNAGHSQTRGSYQSYLISVARNPPNSNFTSNFTFTANESVNNLTVQCGNQLSSCTEQKHKLIIAGKCMLILFS